MCQRLKITFVVLFLIILSTFVVFAQNPAVKSKALNLTGNWKGTANWPGILFTITFSVDKNSAKIRDLKMVYECTAGAGKLEAKPAEPLIISKDNTFSIGSLQGKFISNDCAEGSYKDPSELKCGDNWFKVAGKWTARKNPE